MTMPEKRKIPVPLIWEHHERENIEREHRCT